MPIALGAGYYGERGRRVEEDARLVGQICRSDVLRALQDIAAQTADLRTNVPPRP